MINYNRLGDFLAYFGRLPENKKEYASFVLFKGVKMLKTYEQRKEEARGKAIDWQIKTSQRHNPKTWAKYGKNKKNLKDSQSVADL